MTLNEYILQYRLKQAIDKMAESPNSPLSAISDQVGFSDYKYWLFVNCSGLKSAKLEKGQILSFLF